MKPQSFFKTGKWMVLASIFIFSGISSFSQSLSRIDSLKIQISNHNVQDTSKADLLWKLIIEVDKTDEPQALLYCKQLSSLSDSLSYKKGMYHSYFMMGYIYSNWGDYKTAIDCYLKALKITEGKSDNRGSYPILNNIAEIYNTMNLPDEALKYTRQALAINYRIKVKSTANFSSDENIRNEKNTALLLITVAEIFQDKKNYDSTFYYYSKALKVSESVSDKNGMARAFGGIGKIYAQMQSNDSALAYFHKAIDYVSVDDEYSDDNGYWLAVYYSDISSVLETEKKYGEAIKYISQSISFFSEKNLKPELEDSYRILSDIYFSMGDYRNAYLYKNKSSDLKDTILNDGNSKVIARMQAQFDSEKKQKEIESLNQKNTIQRLDIRQKQNTIYYSLGAAMLVLILSMVIYNRYRVKERANNELVKKNMIIEEKNKQITDNINYAKRIQDAVMTPMHQIKKILPNSFIYFQPKDIVSGDFYWAEKSGNKTLLAVADCTGHGVSASLVTITGCNLLNEAHANGIIKPSEILNYLSRGVGRTFHQDGENQTIKDGMDISICSIDYENLVLEYAGAFNPLWIVRNHKLIEIKADKLQVGDLENNKYTNHVFNLQSGDLIYMFTDGYADQFGGPKEKKLKYKPFAEKLIQHSIFRMEEQREWLESSFNTWKGSIEQTDDVLVIGIKI